MTGPEPAGGHQGANGLAVTIGSAPPRRQIRFLRTPDEDGSSMRPNRR